MPEIISTNIIIMKKYKIVDKRKFRRFQIISGMSVILLFGACLAVVEDKSGTYATVINNIDTTEEDIIEYKRQQSEQFDNIIDQINKQADEEYKRKQIILKSINEVTDEDVKALGNTLYGEARGLSDTEMSAVAWCVLNRLDNGHYGSTVLQVVSAKNQFVGYVPNRAYSSDNAKCVLQHCEDMARDVLTRYRCEKNGLEDVGRTLPKNYLYFLGYGGHNHFTTTWQGNSTWDWSLESPYVD